MENKTVEMVVKDLLLADNRKKKKKKYPGLPLKGGGEEEGRE